MSLLPIGFLSPWILLATLVLPLIWWLLRITPPRPEHVRFPATRLLLGIHKEEQDNAHSPWWLTLLRLMAAGAVILALARPVLNPQGTALKKSDLLLVLVDNGWASAPDWATRHATLRQLLDQAEQQNMPVLVKTTTTPDPRAPFNPQSAFAAREKIAGLLPQPFAPKRMELLTLLQKSPLPGRQISLVWLSDGLDYGHAEKFSQGLLDLAGKANRLTLITPSAKSALPLALYAQINKRGNLQATIKGLKGMDYKGHVVAIDARGHPLLEKPISLSDPQEQASAIFDLPLELRNQVARIELKDQRSAGTSFLVDGRANWQKVGLISADAVEEAAQPLLSSLYYVKKALSPYSQISTAENANTAKAVRTLLDKKISTLVMAGIGRLEYDTAQKLTDWLQRGGIIIRFAGPRLEQGTDRLLPVPLRMGGRSLGGALSWSKPQKLAPFEQNSPFLGLSVPKDVSVRRQVLADPSQLNDQVMIWARLKDGTPLVTARKVERGLLVLFHVTANSDWSDLPHSGLFVQMLRRLTELSTGVVPLNSESQTNMTSSSHAKPGTNNSPLPALPPLRLMDGFGLLHAPDVLAEPIKLSAFKQSVPDAHHRPGLYGTPGQTRAFNIASPKLKLRALPALPKTIRTDHYHSDSATPLEPFFLTLALLLFLADGLIMAFMRGLFSPLLQTAGKSKAARHAALFLFVALLANGLNASSLWAQSSSRDAFALKMSLKTHLAFVRTNDPEINRVNRLGLKTLSRVIARRTAFEPGEPVGVDISKDELAFFPLLYWAVPDHPRKLSSATLARINAYMKQGGMILFDTRDQISNFMPNSSFARRSPLARLLAKMDIPPLEPVPPKHVLTRSFYLLSSFPGRWKGGAMWVEATPKSTGSSSTARSADGVSSILITSNNLAAAWATDENGRTLFSVSPDGERQREMAYRTGINIIMYALTGNYKADQVHLPALMRRLGQ